MVSKPISNYVDFVSIYIYLYYQRYINTNQIKLERSNKQKRKRVQDNNGRVCIKWGEDKCKLGASNVQKEEEVILELVIN